MEKLQKHLDKQTQEEVAQAAERMVKNKTARDIVAEAVAANPKAYEAVIKRMLKTRAVREIVSKRVAKTPEALEIVAAEVSEEDWQRMVKARQAAKAKKSGGQ
jgi:hypothetical protein